MLPEIGSQVEFLHNVQIFHDLNDQELSEVADRLKSAHYSIGAVIFALLHAVVLLGDSYVEFTIFHLAIPFIAPYEPFWTGLGVIGLYLTAALTISFYLRKHIGQKTWRMLHYLTFAAYGLALVHGLMAGTDSNLIGMKLLYLTTGFTILFLTYYRLYYEFVL